MKLEHLKYIVEINDSGSISTAAERMHVSQPAVSQSVKHLEDRLKVKIFKRSRNGAQPTEVGRSIIEKAREVLRKIDEIESIAQVQHAMLEGNLSLVAIPSMCMSLLPKTLSAFSTRFPKVKLEVIETGTLQAASYVEKEIVDFGIMSRREKTDFSDRFHFDPLLVGKVMAYVSRNHDLAGKTEVSIKELIRYPLVLFNQSFRMHAFIYNLLSKAGEPRVLMTVGNPESLKRVVAEGLAIGFYPNIVLKFDPFVQNGDIVALDIMEMHKLTEFGILYKKDSRLSLASREFINELKIQAVKMQQAFHLQS